MGEEKNHAAVAAADPRPGGASSAPGGGGNSGTAANDGKPSGVTNAAVTLPAAPRPVSTGEDSERDLREFEALQANLQSILYRAVDPSAPAETRLAALRELAAIGSPEAIRQMLGAIREIADEDQTGQLALDAVALISELDTPAGISELSDVLTDQSATMGDYDQLPVTVQDAVETGLRKAEDGLLVAKNLMEDFNVNPSPAVYSRVEQLEHPDTMAELIQEALESNDLPLAEERIALLETMTDSRVFDSALGLLDDQALDPEAIGNLVYNWAERRPESVSVDQLLDRLNDDDAPERHRSVAAVGLAGFLNSEWAANSPETAAEIRATYGKIADDTEAPASLRSAISHSLSLLSAPR